jgi:DNA-binding CsgD family transcriptional regulator
MHERALLHDFLLTAFSLSVKITPVNVLKMLILYLYLIGSFYNYFLPIKYLFKIHKENNEMAKKQPPFFQKAPLEEPLIPFWEIPFPWQIPPNQETEPQKIEIALRERIKELNCLYRIGQLADRHSDSIDQFLKNLVDLLPPSWQYPEITCARITFNGTVYKSKGFKVTRWRQSSQILMYNKPAGEVSVFYLEERPAEAEGPFLKEERALIDAIAERIGTIAMRISAELELQEINRQLTVERKALQEANAAMRTVLARIEEQKQEVYQNIQANVEKILMPVLHALMVELPRGQRKYVEILRTQLEEITSPFIKQLSQGFHSLTPSEIEICNLIRSGRRTKEIAEIRGISTATVNRHREHIRRKLKITNQEVNLPTFLQSNMWKQERG